MVICDQVDSNWIKKIDIPFLILYLDSDNVVAIPVYSVNADITIQNHGQSTMANEAAALIQGYCSGKYPPLSSIPFGGNENANFSLDDSIKNGILRWWADEQNN